MTDVTLTEAEVIATIEALHRETSRLRDLINHSDQTALIASANRIIAANEAIVAKLETAENETPEWVKRQAQWKNG